MHFLNKSDSSGKVEMETKYTTLETNNPVNKIEDLNQPLKEIEMILFELPYSHSVV